jgi:hypothetical protein
VAAPPDVKRGLEPKEYLSQQGFPVLEREDIRPPETVRLPGKHMRYGPNPNGRQGTLPIDFSNGKPTHYSTYVAQHGDAINHPTQRDRMYEAKQQQVKEQRLAEIETFRGQQFKSNPKSSQPMLPGMRGSVKRQPKRKPGA